LAPSLRSLPSDLAKTFARVPAVAALALVAGLGTQRNEAGRPLDQFASVNGVKLQYVDWGGHGDVLLFLTGLGASAQQFDTFAPKFVEHFHVLGLTRRGQGLSDKPPTGYGTPTLAEEIRGFLDVMGIDRVSLIAHSIGGVEMTRFAEVYPNRVLKLVYLDAAGDAALGRALMAEAHIPYPPYRNDAERQIDTGQSHSDFTKVTAPALAFFVIYDAAYAAQSDAALCPGCTAEVATNVRRFWQLMYERNFWNEQAERFRRDMHGRVIALHGTNHLFFDDPNQVDDVVSEIRKFLLDE
jgi:pimeloyl-ACP methyl ester carboxylesterase